MNVASLLLSGLSVGMSAEDALPLRAGAQPEPWNDDGRVVWVMAEEGLASSFELAGGPRTETGIDLGDTHEGELSTSDLRLILSAEGRVIAIHDGKSTQGLI